MPTKTLTGAGLNYRQREYWDDVYQKVLSSLQAKKKKASAKLLKSSAARIAWHRFKRKYLKVGDRWVARNKAFAADTIGEGGGSFIMYTTADQAREDAIRDCVYQDVLSYIASEGYLKERSCSDMYPVISSIDGNRVTLFIRSFHSDEKVFSPDRKFVVTVRERRLADGDSRFEIESVRPAFSPSLAMAGGQIKSLLHATPEFYLHGDHMRSIAAAESLEAYEAVSYTNVKWVGDKSRFDSPEALAKAIPRALARWARMKAKKEKRKLLKRDLHLPFREPSGAVNLNGVRNALARLSQVKGVPKVVLAQARRELQGYLSRGKKSLGLG